MTGPVFVAGASGYTGRALVQLLAGQGQPVVAHLRPGSPSAEALVSGFEAAGARVDRSSWEGPAMARSLAELRPAVVFALLGTTRKRGQAARKAGGPAETYQTVDRDLSLTLLAAAEACGSRPRFVYLSSMGAERPGGNAYLQARADVEAALRASPLPWTIARPSFITGPDRPEDRPMERVGAVVADASLGLLGALGARRLRDRLGSIDAAALAAGLWRAAQDPTCAGRVLDSADLRPAPGP